MTENQTDSDLLSDLPLDIIHIILALIPIREAVRTCILSRHWRYIWTSLPVLIFDKEFASTEDKSRTNYEDIITRIIYCHSGPIHKFKLSCFPFRRRIPLYVEWIYFLSRHGIKEIILDMSDEESYQRQLVHSRIHSCGNLTSLKPELCKLDPKPIMPLNFTLKTLNLTSVNLSHIGISNLVSVFPLLERLTVMEFSETELNISSPNLKYLQLGGQCMKLCLSAPLLVELEVGLIEVYLEGGKKRQETSVCNYAELLGGLTDLEKLAGRSDFLKYLSIGIDCCHKFLVFHHLKFIGLDHVNFKDAKERSLLSRLLIGTPNLRELRISTDLSMRICGASGSEAPHLSFGFAPFFKFEKLRVVTMEEFKGYPMEIELIKILLESSPVLETMSIESPYVIGSEEEEEEKKKKKKKKKQQQKLMDELMGCSFASPVVKLNIL